MFYVPSAPTLKPLRSPSLLYAYGSFLCDRSLSPLEHQILPICLFPFPPRSTHVHSVANVHALSPKLILEVEPFDNPQINTRGMGEIVSFATSSSWSDLQIKSGDESVLVRMGLVPSLSQDSMMDVWVSGEDDDELEVEVFRNSSRDPSGWGETSTQCPRDLIHELINDTLGMEIEASPYFSPPEPLSPRFRISSLEENLLASSSSFFGQLLASSSPMSMGTVPSRSIALFKASDASPESFFPASPTLGIRADSGCCADETFDEVEFSMELEDMNLDASFNLMGPSGDSDTSSFEFEVPPLPSDSDVQELISCGAVITLDLYDTLLRTDLPSSPSSMLPTFSSMESLLRMSSDIPDLSLGSFSSLSNLLSPSSSLCQLPTLPSIEDLIRVEPLPGLDTYADADAFQPLPLDTISPFPCRSLS